MSPPHRVLFVEDYPPFKRSFARLLSRRFGLDVIVADSGEEAIGRFGDADPELVILDLGLPGVDGTETLQVIRALPGGESVPVIILTGSHDEELKRATERLDIDGYVLKENATGEFSHALLAVFPDLALPADKLDASAGWINLHGIDENDEERAAVAPRIPRSRRAVRVLLPQATVSRPGSVPRWARHWARRLTDRFRQPRQ